jgi:hypothetical protein
VSGAWAQGGLEWAVSVQGGLERAGPGPREDWSGWSGPREDWNGRSGFRVGESDAVRAGLGWLRGRKKEEENIVNRPAQREALRLIIILRLATLVGHLIGWLSSY